MSWRWESVSMRIWSRLKLRVWLWKGRPTKFTLSFIIPCLKSSPSLLPSINTNSPYPIISSHPNPWTKASIWKKSFKPYKNLSIVSPLMLMQKCLSNKPKLKHKRLNPQNNNSQNPINSMSKSTNFKFCCKQLNKKTLSLEINFFKVLKIT